MITFVKINRYMKTFDIDKLILIDLKSFNEQNIFIIAKFYELNFENIIKESEYLIIYVTYCYSFQYDYEEAYHLMII